MTDTDDTEGPTAQEQARNALWEAQAVLQLLDDMLGARQIWDLSSTECERIRWAVSACRQRLDAAVPLSDFVR